MQFASFIGKDGPTYGIATGNGVQPVPSEIAARFPTLKDAIAAGALAEVASTAATNDTIPLAGAGFLPLIPNPDKIVCIGRNYAAHAAESGNKPTEFPSIFLRLTNTLVAHEKPLIRPRLSEKFDYEGELAVIIGKGGRHIPEDQALKHVAGYSLFMDGSVRDFQFTHSLIAGKNFIGTGGFGPFMTPAEDIPDPSRLTVVSRLNGAELQRGFTRDLIFSIPFLISYISGITELLPGDVIATGTPEGVGFARDPQLWMKAGDTIEVEIDGIGTLRNPVIDEAG